MQLIKNTFLDFPNRFTYLCFFIVTFFASTLCFSQVGINTTTPNASLDIQSSNQATPSNTDGILIPKADAFPLTNPTASQDGMMVFVTGNGTPTKGFYYWNNTTSTWIAFTAIGAEKIDDLLDGKSDNDGTQDGSSVFLGVNAGLNDDSTDNKNVGVGFEALQANTSGTGNIANGYQALYSNTGGNWNVANGRLSLYSNTNGSANTANGNQSLYSNTDGYNNTANGYQSIYSNTSGFDNTASGLQSLYTNTIGTNNTAYGVRSLYLNTEGRDNAATGDRSLFNNTTGRFNTANGSQSLFGNTIGDFNTASGYQSLLTNTEGINNVANGSRSLFSNTTGNDNTASGFRALYTNIDGDLNTAIGSFSLFFNRTGSNNIGLGYQSLLSNTTGSFNIGIGGNTGASNSIGSNNIYLGHSAGTSETGSNKLYIESSNANADNALIYGEFDTNILRANAELQIGNPSGTGFAFPTIDGSANQVLQTDGSGAMSWVDGSTLGSDDADWFEEGTTNAPNNINDNMFTMGNVAIGKTTANYALDIEEDTETRVVNINISTTDNSDNYGTFIRNNSSGTGDHFGNYIAIEGNATGLRYGTYNDMYASGTDDKFAVYNRLTAYNGSVYGVFNFLTNSISPVASANTKYGVYNQFKGISGHPAPDGPMYGIYNDFDQNMVFNTFDKYGTYTIIPSTVGGINYGIYCDVTKANSFAGYFLGNVSVGTTTTNNYILPASRGTANQVMQTDASGNVSWVDDTTIGTDNQNISGSGLSGTTLTIGIENGTSETVDLSSLQDGTGTDNQNLTGATLTGSSLQIDIENGTSTSVDLSTLNTGGDITGVTAGTGLTGGGTTGTVTLNVIANNGLTANANDIVLGGTLTQATTITQGVNNMIFNLNSSGDFLVQDSGVDHFEVRSTGDTYFGSDTYWNDASTTGTTLARLYDGGSGNDGVFEVYKDALVQHSINSAATTVFNELGQDFDFRIEGDGATNLFYVDAGNDRIGIMENTPSFDIHLKQSSDLNGGTGGMGFESSGSSDNWKIYHSGTHFSFAENGTRRAYVEGGTGNYVQPSDERLKRDFILQKNYLSKVKEINIYSYLYKSQTNNKRNIGVKAQELEQLFPELISEGEDGYLGMNYAGLGVIAIQAIKEQQQTINELKSENQQLNNLLSQLLKRVESLENKN